MERKQVSSGNMHLWRCPLEESSTSRSSNGKIRRNLRITECGTEEHFAALNWRKADSIKHFCYCFGTFSWPIPCPSVLFFVHCFSLFLFVLFPCFSFILFFVIYFSCCLLIFNRVSCLDAAFYTFLHIFLNKIVEIQNDWLTDGKEICLSHLGGKQSQIKRFSYSFGMFLVFLACKLLLKRFCMFADMQAKAQCGPVRSAHLSSTVSTTTMFSSAT